MIRKKILKEMVKEDDKEELIMKLQYENKLLNLKIKRIKKILGGQDETTKQS
jgi:hypothetical protein